MRGSFDRWVYNFIVFTQLYSGEFYLFLEMERFLFIFSTEIVGHRDGRVPSHDQMHVELWNGRFWDLGGRRRANAGQQRDLKEKRMEIEIRLCRFLFVSSLFLIFKPPIRILKIVANSPPPNTWTDIFQVDFLALVWNIAQKITYLVGEMFSITCTNKASNSQWKSENEVSSILQK